MLAGRQRYNSMREATKPQGVFECNQLIGKKKIGTKENASIMQQVKAI